MKGWRFAKGKYYVRYCEDRSEILEIQKLRFKTYRKEFNTDFFDISGTDKDKYDDIYDHLVVFDNENNNLVGTYRITVTNSESYFGKNFHLGDDITKVFSNSVEVGRLAIDEEHRNGIVMFLLFRGIGHYLLTNNKKYLMGAGSIPIPQGYNYEEYEKVCGKVISEIAANQDKRVDEEKIEILPSIMRTYLKMGSKILNSPHHDPEFNCIDYPVVMDIDKIEKKYAKFFLE